MDGDLTVVVDGLRKSYAGTVAVAGVSFGVQRGEVFGLLGPNGSGKTTTVECVEGLRRPDAGVLRVLGIDPVREAHRLRPLIGCQLQESSLPDRIRVVEALRLFAAFSPRAGDWRRLVEEWGLGPQSNATFATLSGGQRQRLLVALALVNRPEVVFLDEMTTGLDPEARRVALDLIRRVRDAGTTVVLVTHRMDEAEALCDRIAVLVDGTLRAVDTPRGLMRSFAGPTRLRIRLAGLRDVRPLEALAHVTRARRDDGEVLVEGDELAVLHVGHALLARGLEPEHLRVEQPGLEDAYLHLCEGARR